MHDGSTVSCSENAFDNADRKDVRGKMTAARLTQKCIAGPIIKAPYMLNLEFQRIHWKLVNLLDMMKKMCTQKNDLYTLGISSNHMFANFVFRPASVRLSCRLAIEQHMKPCRE